MKVLEEENDEWETEESEEVDATLDDANAIEVRTRTQTMCMDRKCKKSINHEKKGYTKDILTRSHKRVRFILR